MEQNLLINSPVYIEPHACAAAKIGQLKQAHLLFSHRTHLQPAYLTETKQVATFELKPQMLFCAVIDDYEDSTLLKKRRHDWHSRSGRIYGY
jgi:hypothetical protein